MSASVKIMRSYDYCHFEVCLGTDEELTLLQVDEMRKEAARLVDKAVEQYKIAKSVRDYQCQSHYKYEGLEKEVNEIIANVPESERTPEHKATLKKWGDYCHKMRCEYDYQDDWEEWQ